MSFHAFFIGGERSRSQTKAKAMETHESNIHIGSIIQAQLKADHRSVGWLAREIHCSRNHVYKIFKRHSLDTDLLLRISMSMQFNFFRYYSAEILEGMKSRMGEE